MQQLLKKHQEFLRYALFGIAAVVADVGVYALTVGSLGIRRANAVSWAAALVVAFVTNKYWVFRRGHEGIDAFLRQFLEFGAARAASFLCRCGAQTHWCAEDSADRCWVAAARQRRW